MNTSEKMIKIKRYEVDENGIDVRARKYFEVFGRMRLQQQFMPIIPYFPIMY